MEYLSKCGCYKAIQYMDFWLEYYMDIYGNWIYQSDGDGQFDGFAHEE